MSVWNNPFWNGTHFDFRCHIKVRNTNKAFKHWLLHSVDDTIRSHSNFVSFCGWAVCSCLVVRTFGLPSTSLSTSLSLFLSTSIYVFLYIILSLSPLSLSLSVYLGIFPTKQSNKHCTCIIDGFRWTVAWGLIQQRQSFYKLDLLV